MPDKEKMPVIVVGGLVGVVLLAVLITTIVMMRKINKVTQPQDRPHITEGVGPPYPLGEFIVNLSDAGHYVKTELTLELNAPGKKFEGGVEKKGEETDAKEGEESKVSKEAKGRLEQEIKAREPQIRETVIYLLSSFKSTQIIGKNGIPRVKKLLMRGIQYVLAGGEINLEADENGLPKVREEEKIVDRMEKEGVKIKDVYVTVLQVE